MSTARMVFRSLIGLVTIVYPLAVTDGRLIEALSGGLVAGVGMLFVLDTAHEWVDGR